MGLEPWHKVVTPREEVRNGRSFNPDEFAIALEQVVAGTAPKDYLDPQAFFARTCFTVALREHMGMVLRRLSGETANAAPVLSLITQFGGGKTHTLTALYHLVNSGPPALAYPGVAQLLFEAGVPAVPDTRVAVFVGNAWDPQEGRETPWIDLARRLAGDRGVEVLGPAALTTPPGTEALGRLFEAAGGSVLILCDEVLNFMNRHRAMADPFYAFLQNLTVAMTGTTRSAAVISLPRSQLEMTDDDFHWQEKITRVVRRVARDLIANDEAEIGQVVRLRLFEDLGDERVRRRIAQAHAEWCFERRAQLPPEWTAVDTAATEARSREFLQARFEACYPFHPATLSVFQRKWSALPQYQQTRSTLAMLAQWISCAYRVAYQQARPEPLITLGSAPLEVRDFRDIVLGQLGEARLDAAIDADIAGPLAHARALDADTKDALRDIHRRVGATILFESSGGQVDKVAHLPELRFALGGPDLDTASVDNAAFALEAKGYFFRRVGADGFRIHHTATLKKVMSDRRASLDGIEEVPKAMRSLAKAEFDRGRSISVTYFPANGDEVPNSPKLTLIVMDPLTEWTGNSALRAQVAVWMRQRGNSPRLYAGALVWCFKKAGGELRAKVEDWLAWKRVKKDLDEGLLGATSDRHELAEVPKRVEEAQGDAEDEVWAGYRFVVLLDHQEPDGLRVIDLGAGHSSARETLTGRVISALKSQALLNESVGAGYIERHWPEAFKETGPWPLDSLRQCFLNGALTRLLDPDTVLQGKIVEFVTNGEFGLASGPRPDGTYERIWYAELLAPDEVVFESGVLLLKKSKAEEVKQQPPVQPKPPEIRPHPPTQGGESGETPEPEPPTGGGVGPGVPPATRTLRLVGTVPPEVWNRLGTKVIPKLRQAPDLQLGVDLCATVSADLAPALESELRQILGDLDLKDKVRIERS